MTEAVSLQPPKRKLSIRAKISLVVGSILFLVVAVLITYSYVSDRANNLQVAIDQVRGMNGFYFDSLNTLMIADAMEEREVLRHKMEEIPGVMSVRVIRGEAVNKKFGEGLPNQDPVDELDHRAMAGESILRVEEGSDGRVVTLIEPYLITEDTRGTNCMECHRGIESGTVGGSVRIEYSLAQADELAVAAIGEKLLFILMLFVVGLLALTLLLNRLIAQPVRSVMHRIRDIAAGDGDLTQCLDIRSNDELGELAYWFNQFVGKLNNMVENIRGQVSHLGTAASHMNTTTEQTSASVAVQRNEIDQVTHAMSEMTASVEQVTRNAKETADAAEETNNQAHASKAVMDETIQTIDSLAAEVGEASNTIALLDQKSNEINVVLEVIRNIAEQTNLLALNAAIEAARAGEQGRGFAVVADEVRTLAERTQHSTLEIQTMIESLQQGTKDAVARMSAGKQQADSSVEQAAKAGTSLDSIIQAVAHITEMSEQIAAAAEQHSNLAGQTNQNMSNIQEATTRTSNDAAEVAVASEQLSRVAEDLSSLVQQFQTVSR